MFTGIIEEVGSLNSKNAIGPSQSRVSISCHLVQGDMKLGDSLAVNGVCLTVVRYDAHSVDLEVSKETMDHTQFGNMKLGSKVNLERALRLSDRLGGHLVQGHVDAQGSLLNFQKQGEFYEMEFSLPAEIRRYCIPKGSITIDGISLTMAKLSTGSFTVAVIPHTYQNTILCELTTGSPVHLESDVMARYVEGLLGAKTETTGKEEKSKLSMEFLRENGF